MLILKLSTKIYYLMMNQGSLFNKNKLISTIQTVGCIQISKKKRAYNL